MCSIRKRIENEDHVVVLSNPRHEVINTEFQLVDEVYSVPVLPAYAVLNYSVEHTSSLMGDMGVEGGSVLEGDKLRLKKFPAWLPMEERHAILTVYYSGIRDYQLLFPHIKNKKLRGRLGQLAEEADKTFESGSWMAFSVLAVSVLEGLLFDKLGRKSLYNLINSARKNGVINAEESGLLHDARNARNRIHAGQFEEPFPGRLFGNDLYVLYDRLIKKHWAVS